MSARCTALELSAGSRAGGWRGGRRRSLQSVAHRPLGKSRRRRSAENACKGGVEVRGQLGQTSEAGPAAPRSCCVHAEAPSVGADACPAAAGGMLTDLAVENLICNRRGKALCLSGSRACRTWSRQVGGVQRDGKRMRLQVVIGSSRYDALLAFDPSLPLPRAWLFERRLLQLPTNSREERRNDVYHMTELRASPMTAGRRLGHLQDLHSHDCCDGSSRLLH